MNKALTLVQDVFSVPQTFCITLSSRKITDCVPEKNSTFNDSKFKIIHDID